MNFYEIGHFYTNEHITKESLEYLNSHKFDPSDSICALFIDNYNQNSYTLNVNLLKRYAEEMLNCPISVYYEADMLLMYDNVLGLFKKEDLVITKYNRGKIKKMEIILNDTPITLAEVSPNFKPTCTMLSLIWTLYRSGIIEHNKPIRKVHTLINLRYDAVEAKVVELVNYICATNNIKQPNLKYWWWK